MKHYKYLLLLSFFFFNTTYSQVIYNFNPQGSRVGVNTFLPKTTLDVQKHTDSNGNSFNSDPVGFQAPRITLKEILDKGNSVYGLDQKGALVYVTDLSGATGTGQTANINEVGYYFFDGSKWQKLAISNKLAPGSVICTKMLNPDSRRTDCFPDGTLCTLKYKPATANSKIIVEFNTPYFVSGFDGDEFRSQLKINGTIYGYGYQRWDHDNTGGGGTRSGTLFPLQTQYVNNTGDLLTIDIVIHRSSDDCFQMLYPGSDWFKITEIAN